MLYAVIYAVLAVVPFKDLLIVDVWLFGAYDLLIVLTVIKARSVAHATPAGFRIPGGALGVRLNAAVLGGTWILVLVATTLQDVRDAVAGVVALGLGMAAYPLVLRFRRAPISP
jgi:hypothetical protein